MNMEMKKMKNNLFLQQKLNQQKLIPHFTVQKTVAIWSTGPMTYHMINPKMLNSSWIHFYANTGEKYSTHCIGGS